MKLFELISAVCLLVCGAALAQPVMTQTGHALDANPGAGTGRVNPAAPAYAPNSGQYLMTGQASLGQSFQGFSPILATGQFQGSNLGSATLYDFTRDSVNVQSVVQSGGNVVTMKNQPYVDNARSVFGSSRVSALSASMAVGSSPNGSTSPTVLNPFAQPQYATPAAAARPSAIDVDRPLFSSVNLPDMPLTDQLFTRQRLLSQSSMLPPTLVDYQKNVLDRQLDQALFVRPTPLSAAKSAAPPSPLPELGVNKVEPALKVQEGQPVGGGQQGATGTEKPGSTTNNTTTGGTPGSGNKDNTGTEAGSSGNSSTSDGSTDGAGAKPNPSAADMASRRPFGPSDLDLASRNVVTLRPGQDLYSDLLQRANQIALQQARNKPAGKPEPPATPASSGSPGKQSALGKPAVPPTLATQEKLDPSFGQFRELTPEDVGLAGRPKGTKVNLPAPAAPVAASLVNLQVTYNTYVSSIPSRANRLLAEAEQLLWQRRFYDAIGDLAEARGADPSNPLIWLRSCQAEVAAGEYVAAADDLQEAVRAFPSVITIRGPLPGLSGADGTVRLDSRLAELARLADQAHRTDLWMLLCYMRLATDRPEPAREAARQLVQLGSLNPQEKALVTFVLPPAPVSPTTAPAE